MNASLHMKLPNSFSKFSTFCIIFPSTMHENSSCSVVLPIINIVGLFNFSHSVSYVGIHHGDFNLHFLGDEWYGRFCNCLL